MGISIDVMSYNGLGQLDLGLVGLCVLWNLLTAK